LNYRLLLKINQSRRHYFDGYYWHEDYRGILLFMVHCHIEGWLQVHLELLKPLAWLTLQHLSSFIRYHAPSFRDRSMLREHLHHRAKCPHTFKDMEIQ